MLKKIECVKTDSGITVSGLGEYSLSDTLECGQCFRYERVAVNTVMKDEYIVTMKDAVVHVGQNKPGELHFFGISRDDLESGISEFFSLERNLEDIKRDIVSRTDSEWLKSAAECAGGIAILKQDEWEMLISFIISQNNNIPRIRKIIRQICAEYGRNLATESGFRKCPLSRIDGTPCEEKCKGCGVCYSFPTPRDIVDYPDGLLPSRPGFRFAYILDAAKKVAAGEIDLGDIREHESYAYTVDTLKKIKGVGDKVASCVALFGFANLEAFPIDVWMKRAIDTYFGGDLDYVSLGRYAGVAQQYIFHYIRNLEN
ncbi:MAG: DNA-3-methyladenine glycosylase 2 family protein [Clostridia bacterium]|nr:DNA-3-methyladenine glycosylase 2 family protein [Clostridia bacterium]